MSKVSTSSISRNRRSGSPRMVPTRADVFQVRHSLKRAVIGSAFPQARYLGPAAFSIKPDRLAGKKLRLGIVELEPSAKLSDCISTASIQACGLLLSERALEVFERFDLGRYRVLPALVQRRKKHFKYAYLQIVNDVTAALDFRASQFCIRDPLGELVRPHAVKGYKDFETKARKIHAGQLRGVEEYSYLALKHGVFKSSAHIPDLFTLKASGSKLYISRRLKQAWVKSRLTGLEFKSSRRLVFV